MQLFIAYCKQAPVSEGARFSLVGPQPFWTHQAAVKFVLDEVYGYFWSKGLVLPGLEALLESHGLVLSDYQGQSGVKQFFEMLNTGAHPELATDFLDLYFDSQQTSEFESFYQITDHDI